MKKKWLTFLTIAACTLAMMGCGNKVSENAGVEPTEESQVVAAQGEDSSSGAKDAEETKEESTEGEAETMDSTESEDSQEAKESEETKEPEATQTPAPTEAPKEEETLTEAAAFVSNMQIGWNLGNTFEAYDCTWLSDKMQYETAWQSAKTTREIIDTVHDAGFDSLRLPVSWHNHVDGSYTIDEEWMNRVNEIVDICMDLDMYVILNTHHDISKDYIYPTKADYDRSEKFLTAIWSQLAERYKDYDEKLIFESMNETRLVGTNVEWWLDPNSSDCKEAVACINDLNQAFVDTVRQSGGNNAKRFLVIPGYCSSLDGITNAGFVIPTDSANADPHLILVVHAYTPYNFALNLSGTDQWSSSTLGDTSDLVNMVKKLKSTYIDKGIPVIIDEFGALDKNNNTDARTDFAGYYVKLAKNFGMPCFWWDNHNMSGSGEQFTLLDRNSLQWKYPSIVDAMMANFEE